jgi:hypothetical protein
MEYLLVFGIMFIVVAIVSWRWVEGIDYMHKNHPDYKGDDLFGKFDDDVTKTAGRDGWDDNTIHTEGEIG